MRYRKFKIPRNPWSHSIACRKDATDEARLRVAIGKYRSARDDAKRLKREINRLKLGNIRQVLQEITRMVEASRELREKAHYWSQIAAGLWLKLYG